jgi:hypothetical protein
MSKEARGSNDDTFPMVRIPGPSKVQEEEQHADHLRNCIRFVDGRELGEATGRDGDPGVRVDFLFDNGEPPVALEITRITDAVVAALGNELLKLEKHLAQIARTERLGGWMLGFRLGTRVRDVESRIATFIRSPEHTGTAHYSAAEAPPRLGQATLSQLVELFQLGLESALRMDGGDGVSIHPVGAVDDTGGFGTLLRFAIGDNIDKLHETRPRETHLFVVVGLPVSSDPAHTHPPDLPEGLDTLWVYLGYWNAKYDYRLWRTSRENPGWELLEHPLGQPPRRY